MVVLKIKKPSYFRKAFLLHLYTTFKNFKLIFELTTYVYIWQIKNNVRRSGHEYVHNT